METISEIIKKLLEFLLRLLELFVSFVVAALNLVLEFARHVVGLIT